MFQNVVQSWGALGFLWLGLCCQTYPTRFLNAHPSIDIKINIWNLTEPKSLVLRLFSVEDFPNHYLNLYILAKLKKDKEPPASNRTKRRGRPP
jgi:hypothetical protein